ncbi:MAG: hypothetical protein ACREIF_06855 [Chthoniobacterales bacterium]
MRNRILATGLLAGFLFLSTGSFFAQQQPALSIEILTTFDYPGRENSTIPEAINDRGDIAGLYSVWNGSRGFVRFRNGTFSAPIIEPNDTGNDTEGRGINHARTVCGNYSGSDGFSHGYFLSGGSFTEFDVMGANDTLVEGLNDAGDFVGAFDTDTQDFTAFSNIGGITTAIVIPGAISSLAFGINSSREITGQYTDSGGVFHGWWQDSSGALHFPFDPPNSIATLPFGINDQGYIVGRYSNSGVHAFLFKPSTNSYLTFDFPGAIFFTAFNGINRDGLLCGRYQRASGFHGFLARVVTGQASEVIP